MSISISGVLTLHNEGLLCYRTMKSIARCMHIANDAGLFSELHIVLDSASPETAKQCCEFMFDGLAVYRHHVSFHDPGLSRNLGVTQAQGSFVAIFDGDDLYSDNWLSEAYRTAASSDTAVVHPEITLFFDSDSLYTIHQDQEAPDFDPAGLLYDNLWSALCFARREVFELNPYHATTAGSGFGYEDWHWNCEAIACGFVHTVARRTAHFVRLKSTGSRNVEALTLRVVPRHSRIFDSREFWEGALKGHWSLKPSRSGTQALPAVLGK